ncbi:putative alpha-galactosidase [Aspergillus brunneoviolaceus CBS 621.78]|uniref:Alpha-galactosidase n=1 Tax=Aspergillus brunneoviolaceus CBS 621.78 TaxID=1450534 RepID=A0ACD1GDN4_9EURO|nr:putative alpha-galactosidase [Aspergillus brunneoviolaceus CBS 621.78]RAH47415.1 putative alpha-galactosidase [Aspergillus brunneoviolaceus CBS 621.78]
MRPPVQVTLTSAPFLLTLLLLLLLTPPSTGTITNPTTLPTPPMGFNNWSRFMCDLNETLFVTTATAMQTTGLQAAGYTRLNLDDCWMETARLPNGSLSWNTTKFPRGIPWLAAHLGSLNFTLGIYQDAGNATCGGYPGSYGHEALDAATFAEWGIDYLKLDGCNVFPAANRTLQEEYRHRYANWHTILSTQAAQAQNRKPLIFSESAPAYFAGTADNTDWYKVMAWVPRYGELARHSTDILVYAGAGSAWDSIVNNYDYNVLLARYQRPGYFNDPDFLIPDHPGLTLAEKKSHFALWAVMGAPLIISAYIPGLGEEVVQVLRNERLIAVDQDALGLQATLAVRGVAEGVDVLTRSLGDGGRVVAVLNRGNGTVDLGVAVERLGLQAGCEYEAEDLWDGRVVRVEGSLVVEGLEKHATGAWRVRVPHGCKVVPTGIVFNTASGRCLTAVEGEGEGKGVGFETCEALDAQVWQVTAQGALRPLSNTALCLTAAAEEVSLQACKGGTDQKWEYAISGNLRNAKTGECLTEGDALVGACLVEADTQVFGLPSGVALV